MPEDSEFGSFRLLQLLVVCGVCKMFQVLGKILQIPSTVSDIDAIFLLGSLAELHNLDRN